jgi:hypothetical protein
MNATARLHSGRRDSARRKAKFPALRLRRPAKSTEFCTHLAHRLSEKPNKRAIFECVVVSRENGLAASKSGTFAAHNGPRDFRFARRSAGRAIVISCCTVFPAARAVSK